MFAQKMLVASVMGSLLLAGCGSSGSGKKKPVEYLTGQFWSVANLNYKTQTQKGVTDSQGRFKYKTGETVVFSFGDIILPPLSAAPILSPRDFGADIDRTVTLNGEKIDMRDITGAAVTNITRWLITLDADGMLDNGIQLDKAAALIFTNDVKWDTPPEEFDREITADFTKLYTQTPKLAVAPQLLSPYVGYFYLAQFLNKNQPGSYTSGYRLGEIEVVSSKSKKLESHTYLYGQEERLTALNVLTYYGADASAKPAQLNSYTYNTDGSLKSHERSNYNYWDSTGNGSLLKKSRDDYAWTKNTLNTLTTFNLTAGSGFKEQAVEYVYSPFFTVSQTKTTDFVTPSSSAEVAVWTMQEGSRWLYGRITQDDGATSELSYDEEGRLTAQLDKDAAGIEIKKTTYTYPSPGKRVAVLNNQYFNEDYLLAPCAYEQLHQGLRTTQATLLCLPSYFFE